MFKKKQDLFGVNIIHSLPGRIRLNCIALKYLKELQLLRLRCIDFISGLKPSKWYLNSE